MATIRPRKPSNSGIDSFLRRIDFTRAAMAAPPSARHLQSCHRSERTAPCARTARRKDDVSRPVSWLAGHNPSPPSRPFSEKPSGTSKKDSPPTVAGAALDLVRLQSGSNRTKFPFLIDVTTTPKHEQLKLSPTSCQDQ